MCYPRGHLASAPWRGAACLLSFPADAWVRTRSLTSRCLGPSHLSPRWRLMERGGLRLQLETTKKPTTGLTSVPFL